MSPTGEKKKVALVTGVSGQSGSYLAELLLEKGYEVHGMIRPASTCSLNRIAHLCADPDQQRSARITLHYGDLIDGNCVVKILNLVKPDEIYNMAAQPNVSVGFQMAEYTAEVVGVGVLRLLEAIRICGMSKTVRLLQPSTSDMFGAATESPQKETTPFAPKNPYSVSKLFAHWSVINHRESDGLFAAIAIPFNHESPRRGETYVTRKITRSVAKIFHGHMDYMELGFMDAVRDWGHARDYMECYWRMLQEEEPNTYVIATGECHTVREFVEAAFKCIGREIVWEGKGQDEVGKEKATGIVRLRINPKYYRPSGNVNVCPTVGDYSKVQAALGWKPTTKFDALVEEMVKADVELMGKNPEA